MPLPTTFPEPPRRPQASVPLTDKAWLDYFSALDRFNAAVRAFLDALP